MALKKKKRPARPVFDSIRKPTAPPSQKFDSDRAEEKIHPAKRKTKHKQKADGEE